MNQQNLNNLISKTVKKNSLKSRLKERYLKTKTYILGHKKTSVALGIVLLLIIYWLVKVLFPASTVTTYAVAEVQKDAIVTNVTGSGQVSASNQIDLKAKTSGNILKISATTGQEVKAGQVIATLDDPTAYLNLKSAQIAYDKLVQPADASTRIQAENDLNNTKQSLDKANNDLSNAYDSAYSNTSSLFLDLNDIIDGTNNLISGSGFLSDQSLVSKPENIKNEKTGAETDFNKTKIAFQGALSLYKSTTRTDSTSSLDSLFQNTFNTSKDLSNALKEFKNILDAIKSQDQILNSPNASNPNSAENVAGNNLTTWIDKINSDLSNLSGSMSSIQDLKNTIKNSPQTLAQKQAALDKIVQGADNLDVASQQINLQQAQLAYENTFITAPFDGVIAKISANPSDSISSGAVIGTIITKNKVADIIVNEVDAAKIVAGQKASLTFDAIDGLEISGVVQSIDLVGTVTQGVVNYNVKITFDVQDDRVKSGMSVSASIITSNKQDVIVVPNSAVKSKNGTQYVEVFSQNVPVSTIPETVNETPVQQTVTVGLSNDTETEITSGLNVGDRIVTKTTTGAASTAKTSTAPSLFGSGGRGGATGGGGSIIRTGGGGAPAGR